MSALNQVAWATAAVALLAAKAPAQLPIDALARHPAMTSVSMSEDGSYLVSLMDVEGELVLTVRDLENPSSPPVATRPSDRMKFIAAQALKADRLFVLGRQEWTGALMGCGEGAETGSTRTFVTKLYMTDTELGSFEEPFTRGGRAIGVSEETERCFEIAGEASLAADLPLSADEVIAVRTDKIRLMGEYYRVNLRTGAERLVYRETESESAVLFDLRTGELLVKAQLAPVGGGNYEFRTLIRNAGGGFDVHEALTSTAADRHTVNVVGRDEATGKYYVVTDLFTDKAGVYFYDPQSRRFDPEPLFAIEQFDATGVILGTKASDFNQLLGFTYIGAREEEYYVDPTWVSIADGLKNAFPGKAIDILEYTSDRSKILFSVSSSTQPPVYYLLHDLSRTELVGAERPWIDPGTLRETQLVYYEARDGLRIPAFLTLPNGWTPDQGRLPAVVLPHGGPWARDTSDWDASGWPQFLASRGYAVLQPQYRGSEGWGHELWLAGDAEWGQKMQDDKDDGAAWLVAQGYADPDRIAIFGYSYGGFAAMAAVVRPGGPFKCAIAGAGVANLARLGNNWSDDRIQRAYQGRTVKGMDPMQNTEKASIPVLIYSGDRDVRVPIFHSQTFYNAVKDRVPAKFVTVPNMPHSLPWYPEHHRQTLSEIESFLADDCGLGAS